MGRFYGFPKFREGLKVVMLEHKFILANTLDLFSPPYIFLIGPVVQQMLTYSQQPIGSFW